MLTAVIGPWTTLKSTSITGLRRTFLQRPGKLVWGPGKVTLTMESKTVDIILE